MTSVQSITVITINKDGEHYKVNVDQIKPQFEVRQNLLPPDEEERIIQPYVEAPQPVQVPERDEVPSLGIRDRYLRHDMSRTSSGRLVRPVNRFS